MAALDPADTVSHAVNISKLAFFEACKKVKKFLGLLRFSELDVRQRIGTLSGAPVILLDEPTNHLDLTSSETVRQ